MRLYDVVDHYMFNCVSMSLVAHFSVIITECFENTRAA